MMQTSNPVFKAARESSFFERDATHATFAGILSKTALAFAMVFVVAALSYLFIPPMLFMPLTIGAGLLAMVAAFIVASRRQVKVEHLALYSLVEGVFLGCVSRAFDGMYPGIVVQAVLATLVVAGLTLAAFSSGKIRVSPSFRKMVGIGTLALVVLYLVNLVLALLHVNLGLVSSGAHAGPLSWAISLVAVCLATFNLVLDFDSARGMVESGAPASEEWRAAFGLLVTLVWLYVELLRVLSYFRK